MVRAPVFTAIDEFVDAFHDQHHAPGIQLGVLVNGEVAYFTGRGVTDCATDAPAGEEGVFRIVSMSKSFTAAAVLQLRDQKLLGLDEPVRSYLPRAQGLRLPTADSPEITVRHCLTMSSGLPTDDAWADRKESMTQATFDEMLANRVKAIYSPGAAFVYSNLGYAILGRIIEAVTAMSFVDYATKYLLEPLEMNSTTYDYRSVPLARLAKGYRRTSAGSWELQPFTSPGSFSAIGGVLSTVSDIARWVHWLADAFPARDDTMQNVLSRSSRREMQQGHRLLPATLLDDEPEEFRQIVCGPFAYGYGLFVDSPPGGDMISHHRGGYPGFGSYMAWQQDSGVAVVALANGTYAPVHVPARAALNALLDQQQSHLRPIPEQPEMRAFRELIERTVSNPLTLQDPAYAANVLLDIPLEERTSAIRDARDLVGERTGQLEILQHSPNEATFRFPSTNGRIDVTVALTPTVPPQIQTWSLRAVAASAD